jgi:hypothetical protein
MITYPVKSFRLPRWGVKLAAIEVIPHILQWLGATAAAITMKKSYK